MTTSREEGEASGGGRGEAGGRGRGSRSRYRMSSEGNRGAENPAGPAGPDCLGAPPEVEVLEH